MSKSKYQISNQFKNPKVSKFGNLSFSHLFEIRNLAFGFHGDKGGFIALISAIIISFLLLTITVVLNFSAFFGRFNILDSEFKEASVGLAEACADVAMLELTKGNTVGASIDVGFGQCTSVSVSGSATKIIRLKANFKNSYTNLKISFTPSAQVVSGWVECPGTCP